MANTKPCIHSSWISQQPLVSKRSKTVLFIHITETIYYIISTLSCQNIITSRSQWQSCLRRGSAADCWDCGFESRLWAWIFVLWVVSKEKRQNTRESRQKASKNEVRTENTRVQNNPAGPWISVCCKCCVLSGTCLYYWPIPRQEESYWLWCIIVCDL